MAFEAARPVTPGMARDDMVRAMALAADDRLTSG
jgi:hypothetical protein